MTRKLLLPLTCLALAVTLSACIEEDSGMAGYFDFEGEIVPVVYVTEGTGLPQAALLESVTYTNNDKETFTERLGHVRVDFRSCETEWCAAEVDDCGIESSVNYAYEEVNEAKTIAFKNFDRSPAISQFAATDTKFALTRDGAAISLACSECPGRSINGRDYTSKTVSLQAIR